MCGGLAFGGGRDSSTCQDGGNVGAGHQSAAELLDHDCGVGDSSALSPALFADVQGVESVVHQFAPVRRAAAGAVGLEQFTGLQDVGEPVREV